MWPSKKKVGPQLTHGIEGPGVYREAHDPHTYWSFTNELNDPICFGFVAGSKQILRKPAPVTFTVEYEQGQQRQRMQQLQSEVFVPNELGKKLQQEARSYDRGIHDPLVSERLIIANLKVQRALPLLVLAYVKNERQLHFSLLMWRERAVLDMSTRDIGRFSVPWISKSVVINMSSDILQISFEEPFDEQGGKNCLVLTRESMVLFRLNVAGMSKNNLSLEVIKHAEWTSQDMDLTGLAYASLNPFNPSEISVVNVHGEFRIIEIQKKGSPFVPKHYPNCSIYDPLVLSRFKRVIWGASLSELIIFSRSRLYRYDTVSFKLTELITAMAWSKILDLKRLPFVSEYFALLTDKELIVTDFSDGAKKVIAFKHCLADDDPSMTLTVSKCPVPSKLKDDIALEQIFICTVLSKVSKLVWNVKIGLENGTVVLVGEPFITPFSLEGPLSGLVHYAYEVDEDELFGKLRGFRENLTSASTGAFSVNSWKRKTLNTDAKVSRPISLSDVPLGFCIFSLSSRGELVSSSFTSEKRLKLLPESRQWFTCSEELKDTLLEELDEERANADEREGLEEADGRDENTLLNGEKNYSLSHQVGENLKELYAFLVDVQSDDTLWGEDEKDKIQELASDFTTSITDLIRSERGTSSNFTLFEAIDNGSLLIDDLAEVDYMLKSLFENFAPKSIDFKIKDAMFRKFMSPIVLSDPEAFGLSSLRALLPSILSPDTLNSLEQSLIARDVGLSFISFQKSDQALSANTDSVQNGLPHRYQMILEKWGDSYIEQEETNLRLTQRLDSQQIPTVLSSQKRPRHAKYNKTAPKSSTSKSDRLFSIPSSLPVSESQTVESSMASSSSYGESAPKRKKSKKNKKSDSSRHKQRKRLGGFM